jgi:hypothetical protein
MADGRPQKRQLTPEERRDEKLLLFIGVPFSLLIWAAVLFSLWGALVRLVELLAS